MILENTYADLFWLLEDDKARSIMEEVFKVSGSPDSVSYVAGICSRGCVMDRGANTLSILEKLREASLLYYDEVGCVGVYITTYGWYIMQALESLRKAGMMKIPKDLIKI